MNWSNPDYIIVKDRETGELFISPHSIAKYIKRN